MAKLKIGVLISGRGSNLQALIDACAQANFPAEIVLVISNKADAGGLERAKAAKIKTKVINHKDYDTRENFDYAMHKELEKAKVQLVCLAGFMRLLSPWFAKEWRDRMMNIHPSLLPKHKGLDTHRAALAAGDHTHGCTVHFVRAELDAGPIILQAEVPVLPDDTEETLSARVLEQEHKIYPEAVHLYAEGRVNIIDEQVFIAGIHESGKISA
ncbi:MAG TPA: phosphoribosylglycinamide formyltransferase [Alphaproteobacteria bacterium]|nr:phosphoribosylglycinamide formyltransferase [Alphaproteobacteria bacterium]